MSKKRALITGITGQDGSYLADLLLEQGYEVHGIVRRVAVEVPNQRLRRIEHIVSQLHLHPASLENFASLYRVIADVKPDECYHLAAQSFVAYSFQDEFSTLESNICGTHYLLAAIKDLCPECRFYFAGSSEMFGHAEEVPQKETTRFHPRSPYGVSKVAGFELTRNYRETYGIHASTGILFSHESPRRGAEFVTRRITLGLAAILAGKADSLTLGNLQGRRDWGHARDYVDAMWRMLQQDTPDDYVVSTGQVHSVQDFVEMAFDAAGLDYQRFVRTDPGLYRPAEPDPLVGDCSKARRCLGWRQQTSFRDLVQDMVRADCGALLPAPVPGSADVRWADGARSVVA